MDEMEGFRADADTTGEQILKSLISANPKDIDLITEIHSPVAMAQLDMLSKRLAIAGYEKSSQLINTYLNSYKRYMISYNRQSRKEIILALSDTSISADVSLSEKAMGRE